MPHIIIKTKPIPKVIAVWFSGLLNQEPPLVRVEDMSGRQELRGVEGIVGAHTAVWRSCRDSQSYMPESAS